MKLEVGLSRKVEKNRYKYFNNIFLLTTAILLGTVGIFNYFIDPYGLYASSIFPGINNSKPKKDDNDRLYKAADIIRMKPQTIILGSSRTKRGIDPNYVVFNKSGTIYNSAINGPNFYEVYRYLEHTIKNSPNLQEVILGMDFFMFNSKIPNKPTFSESRLDRQNLDLQDIINYTFSLDAIVASGQTIVESQNQPQGDINYGLNGFRPHRNANNGQTEWRFEQSIDLYFNIHQKYQFSEEYLEYFKKLVQLAKEKQIKLIVFISPAHATDLEAIEITGRWSDFERWKRELVKITPVWDFFNYNSVTTEAIKKVMQNYVDNSHYTPEVGNRILDRVFNHQVEAIPKDFGILLTPNNIEEQIKRVRLDREVWKKEHPKELALVKKKWQPYIKR